MQKEVDLNYQNIIHEAASFAAQYRQTHDVPALPGNEQIEKYMLLVQGKFAPVTELIKARLAEVSSDAGHGYEHLVDVATRAGFLIENECNLHGVPVELRDKLVEQAVLSGLLHDIERHLGFGEQHQIEGEKTAARILKEVGLEDRIVLTVVRNHDHMDFEAGDNEDLERVFAAIWDSDHFRYGLEREDGTIWETKQQKGITPEKVVHDYQYLLPYRDSWRTTWGKENGPKYIDFGLAIAKHIEQVFSTETNSDENEVKLVKLSPDRWQEYKNLRLSALQADPHAFGSSYAKEVEYPDDKWQQRLASSYEGKSNWLVFAEAKGKLVGMMGAWQSEEDKENKVATIVGVYVTPESRGRRISQKLMQGLIDQLKSNPDISKLKLTVNKNQTAAVKLYERYGFKIVGQENAQLGDGNFYDEYLMEKYFSS